MGKEQMLHERRPLNETLLKDILFKICRRERLSLEEADQLSALLCLLFFKKPKWTFQAISLGLKFCQKLPEAKSVLDLKDPRMEKAILNLFAILEKVHPLARKKFLRAQIIGRGLVENFAPIGHSVRERKKQEWGVTVPWAVVIDVTSRCNKRCRGCLAGNRRGEPQFDELLKTISQAYDLGTSTIVFSGGEPLLREKDIFAITSKFPALNFVIFTNGSLVSREFSRKYLETEGTVICFVSLEGFKETTEKRRGEGSFEEALRAISCLKAEGVPFGVSITCSQENFSEVTSNQFADFLQEIGSYLVIFLPYAPVGRDPDENLVLTSDQREKLGEFGEKLFQKGIFSLDPHLLEGGSCMAGDGVIAITSQGEVQPCPFIPWADKKVFGDGGVTLVEALGSQLMVNCRKLHEGVSGCLVFDQKDLFAEVLDADVFSTDVNLT